MDIFKSVARQRETYRNVSHFVVEPLETYAEYVTLYIRTQELH